MASFTRSTGTSPRGGRPQRTAAAGSYITDGKALFCVQGVLSDSLLELENCMTLELLVCHRQRTAQMRVVVSDPALARDGSEAATTEVSMSDPWFCERCAEVIGVYEPLVLVAGGIGRETSRAALEDSDATRDAERFHRGCYERSLTG